MTRRSEIDSEGNVKRAATRPKAKRFTSETLPDKDLLLIAMLTLWRAAPDFYFDQVDSDEFDELSIARVWDSETDTAVKIAGAMAIQQMTDIFFRMSPSDPAYSKVETRMKSLLYVFISPILTCLMVDVSPATLTCVAKRLLMSRLEPDSQRLWITIASQVIEGFHRKSEVRFPRITDERASSFFRVTEL